MKYVKCATTETFGIDDKIWERCPACVSINREEYEELAWDEYNAKHDRAVTLLRDRLAIG